MELREIFKKNKCDRWEHNYHVAYEEYWRDHREEPINILELGVWNGYGINSWLEYFPNATVYGIDVFERVSLEDAKKNIKDMGRVELIKGSSQTPEAYEKLGDITFDMIIDDAQHTPKANRLTFESAIDYLKEDGAFFIEDVWPLSIMTDKEKSLPWLKKSPDDYNEKEYNEFLNTLENYGIAMYDFRRNFKADSCIMRVTK